MFENVKQFFESMGANHGIVAAIGAAIGVIIAWLVYRYYSKGLAWAEPDLSELNRTLEHQTKTNRQLKQTLETRTKQAANFDWAHVKGVDKKTGAILQSFGIRNLEHLQSLPLKKQQTLMTLLNKKGVAWNSSNISNLKPAISLPQVSGAEVDWSTVKGVEPKVAAELKSLGVKNVEQLEAFSVEDRAKLETQLKSKGLSWDWNQLSGWKTGLLGAAGLAGGAAIGANSWSEKSTTGSSVDVKTTGNVSDQSATTSSGFVSPNTSVKHGNFDSSPAMAHQPPATAPNRPFGDAPNEKQFALPFSAGPVVDWDQMDGVNPKLAKEFADLGLKNPQQLAALTPEEKSQFYLHMKSRGIDWNWNLVERWNLDPNANDSEIANKTGVANKTGIASKTENRVVGFAGAVDNTPATQTSKINPADFEGTSLPAAPLSLPFESRKSDESRTSGGGSHTSGGAHTSGGSHTSGESQTTGASKTMHPAGAMSSPSASQISSTSSNVDPNAPPVLFQTVPQWRDDLTLLEGIDGPQSIELRKMGIYNFEQLHNLSPESITKLQTWFRRRGWYLDMEQWRIASDGNTLTPSMDEIRTKAYEIFSYRNERGLHGGDRTDWNQAEWELRGNPNFGYGIPHHVDDFAVSLSGVSSEVRDELYRMGLYNQSQVNELNPQQRRLLTQWFAGPRFGIDLTQALGWLSTLKEIPEHLSFGRVFSTRPFKLDDLSQIEGLEPSTESDLNRIGIYRFEQMLDWNEQNIHAIAEALDCSERTITESWVPQAEKFLNR